MLPILSFRVSLSSYSQNYSKVRRDLPANQYVYTYSLRLDTQLLCILNHILYFFKTVGLKTLCS